MTVNMSDEYRAAKAARWAPLIENMLAAASDPRTPPGEADRMREKALELMAKYAIDEALISAANGEHDPIVHAEYVFDLLFAREFALILGGGIVAALGCKAVASDVIIGSRRKTGVKKLSVFGRKSVVDRVMQLFPSLTMQCLTELSAAARERTEIHRLRASKAYKRAFIIGYGNKVVARMQQLVSQQKASLSREDASTYALVLVTDLEKAQQLADQEYPSTRIAKTRSYDPAGRRSGDLAGNRADLGASRLGSNRLQITGS